MTIDWVVETMRVSLFATSPVQLGTYWSQLMGGEPDEEHRKSGQHSVSGPFGAGMLSLTAALNRLDCVLTPKPVTDLSDGSFPSVGRWTSVNADFFDLTKKWLTVVPENINRVAIGAALVHPELTRSAAYEALLTLMKSVKGDPKRMRELTYRVNWPVESTSLQGLTLNRLTTFAVLQLQVQALTSGEPTAMGAPSFFVRLELDHNTAADRKEPFTVTQRAAVFSELADLSRANVADGEVL